MNTCDTCKHYTMPEAERPDAGDCALIDEDRHRPNGVDGLSSGAEYLYESWVYVGPKFGCIHWMAKEAE